MVREIKISGRKYNSSEEIARSEFAENLLKSDRGEFVCFHLNIRNQVISFEVVSTGSLSSSLARLATLFFIVRVKAIAHPA